MGWKELPIQETELSREPLVPLGIFSEHPKILTSSAYADEHDSSPYVGGLEGSLTALFVRQGVAERLDQAAGFLPRGYHLMAMDTYRTLEVQQALYDQYSDGLRRQHADWSDEEISAETQKYVSLPSHDPTRPSPHNTGGAVDLLIVKVPVEIQDQIDEIDKALADLPADNWQADYLLQMQRSQLMRLHASPLEFGTQFDHGGAEAALRHYEELLEAGELNLEDEEALQNRRLLYSVMIKAGFEPYADEWWHYNDPATQMGAKVAGREYAEYGAVELSKENTEFAQMRFLHNQNSARLARGEDWIPPKGLEEHFYLAKLAIRGVAGNPRNMWQMQGNVAKIAPPENETAA